MIKMRIGVDIDGTVADLYDYLSKNLDFDFKKVKDYSLKGTGLSLKRLTEVLKGYERTGEYLKIKPIKGAVEGINKLAENGHSIYFITARDQYNSVDKDTFNWLNKNKFVFTLLITHSPNKNKVLKKLDIPILIDDNPNEVKRCSNSGIECLLIDQPWNKDLNHNIYDFTRFKGKNKWKKIVKYLT